MLVSVSSCRGAPGVSSWSLALATAWPHQHDRVLVEADCSGGVFGCRYDVPLEPGSAELVSQARRARFDDPLELSSFARHIRTTENHGSELWVVPSPLSSHEALDVWRAMSAPAAEAMHHDDRLWLADCGRVWHRSPVEPLLAIATLSIIVSDGSMPSLLVLRSRVESLPNRTAVIVVGDMQYSTDELLDFTGADYVWNVPRVKRLDALAADFATGGRARRTKTWRTALTIAHTLAADLRSDPAPTAGHTTTAASKVITEPLHSPEVAASTNGRYPSPPSGEAADESNADRESDSTESTEAAS